MSPAAERVMRATVDMGMRLPPICADETEAWLLEEALRLRAHDEQRRREQEQAAVDRARRQGEELLRGAE